MKNAIIIIILLLVLILELTIIISFGVSINANIDLKDFPDHFKLDVRALMTQISKLNDAKNNYKNVIDNISLTDDNLGLFTQIDKGLDSLSEEHSKVEKDLSDTKDKLIEVVKKELIIRKMI